VWTLAILLTAPKLPKIFMIAELTDMTIHYKALAEHFLMVPLVFQFNHFLAWGAFSDFSLF
jgi:hypothetical protein